LGNHASKYDFSLKEGTLETTEGFYSSGYGNKEKTGFLRSVIEGSSDFDNKLTVRIKQGKI